MSSLYFSPVRLPVYQLRKGLTVCSFHNRRVNKPNEKDETSYKDCYRTLGVQEGCTQVELKEAFLSLAKLHHPDSHSPSSDPAKFREIEGAYRTLQEKLNDEEILHSEVETAEKDFGIKHTVPQHRQYLGFDGVGCGTPSQRQQQYQSYRLSRATDAVLDKRVRQSAEESEDRLVLLNKQQAQKHKPRNAMERLVEDLIQESMMKGEFSNLPGQGKPINHSSFNPHVDYMTHKLNEILINNGFTPEWITLAKEIREDSQKIKQVLSDKRGRFGRLPLSDKEKEEWQAFVQELKCTVQSLDEKIDKYNLMVPFLYKQMVHFPLEREAARALEQTPPPVNEDKKPYFSAEMECSNQPTQEQMGAVFTVITKIFRNE